MGHFGPMYSHDLLTTFASSVAIHTVPAEGQLTTATSQAVQDDCLKAHWSDIERKYQGEQPEFESNTEFR